VNHKPCKCGKRPTGVLREGRAMDRVVCMCGRSGPFADTIEGSWAAWDADHQAVAKAREALEMDAAQLAIDAGLGASEWRSFVGILPRGERQALALLGEGHGNE
jgi:hypothetical protein